MSEESTPSDPGILEDDSARVPTIKETDPDLRPQERALKYGVKALATYELLALILRAGQPGMPITDITRNLLKESGDSLHMLGRKSLKELRLVKGMGEVRSLQVMSIMELAKRYFCEDNVKLRPVIQTSSDIYNLIRIDLADKPQEEIWLITLSRANRVINRHMVTRGSAVASVFDLKACIKLAILDSASSIILCHNHPSGNTRPSAQDDRITHALFEAAKMMDLRMLDHIIVTHSEYYSYNDNSRLH